MTAQRQESLARTFGVAGGVALFCSLLVATAVYLLRPIELALSAVERNRAVVAAAGLAEDAAALGDREVVDRFLELDARIVALETGEFEDAVEPAGYDFRAAAEDPSRRVTIPDEFDTGALDVRPRAMPVYIARDDGGPIERIVLPVYGRGMWSTVYLYVALERDMTTIADVVVFEQGETPGIGDRIENPAWLARWRGKKVYGPDGALRFRIAAEADTENAQYRVDAITGATVTVTSVDQMMRYWFSPHGYAPLLERLRGAGGD